ncbi:MAG: T9SS type A sorting domain-containing protein [Saprospiraceae bacterium]|nr:T9SS type A sorting domain-containing protein [Saprospiraceae bacterium]
MRSCSRFLVLSILLGLTIQARSQAVFPPGSVWKFDGSDISFSGPYSYYIQLEATDKDSLFNGFSWQIMKWHSELKDGSSGPVSVKDGLHLYRREGIHLVQAFKGDPEGERVHAWHLDASVGDTLYYMDGGPLSTTTLPHTEVIDVDTVFESGFQVQQLTLVQSGYFQDTLVVQPWTGVLQRQQSVYVNEHIGDEFSIYPFIYNLVDIGHLQLTCFTFPDGTNVHYRQNCGKLINSIDPSDNESKSLFYVFPNPIQDQLYLHWPVEVPFQDGTRIILTNPSGVTVFEQEILDPHDQVFFVNLSHLPSSIYLLQVIQENGVPIWSSKVMKH